MTTVEAAPQPTIRRRVFNYDTSVEWLGRRNGRISSAGRDTMAISSPPEFRGEEGLWTPEHLFIGAVESCLMVTFAAIVEKHHLPVESYASQAHGILEQAEGEYRFTRIEVRPTIVITEAAASHRVMQAVEAATRDCLISNSVRAIVEVKPSIVLSASE